MPRGHLTAIMVALALGTSAPRLAAQDTSAGGRARPDTSGYSGTGGVDTSGQPGRVGAIDTTGAVDSLRTGSDSMAVPGPGPGAGDSSGMQGRHPSATLPGDSAATTGTMGADSAGVSEPTKEPGQSPSRTGDSASTSSP